MAEAIVLPLLLIGSFYVLSNKEKTKEKFTNMNGQANKNYLPNTAVNNRNYPISKDTPIDPTSKNYIQQYTNPNQTTDKFFNGNNGYTGNNGNNGNY